MSTPNITELNKIIIALTSNLATVQKDLTALHKAVDTSFVEIAAFLVFFMQIGFLLLEIGAVRGKFVMNIIMKNVGDVCICTVVWFIVGQGFAFGKDAGKFIGTSHFCGQRFDDITDTIHARDWLFQWAFASTATTIVSGAMAERCKFPGQAIQTTIMAAWIYPLIVHWTWGGGFLNLIVKVDSATGISWGLDSPYQLPQQDFAGSGIVHLVGGTAGLIGTLLLRPRKDRFKKYKGDIEKQRDHDVTFKGHNMPYVAAGTMILWFGWYGFNAGSALGITASNETLTALVSMNTSIAAAISGITAFMIELVLTNFKIFDPAMLLNGILGGLVAITAGCNAVHPYGALIIGILAGFIYIGSSKLLKRLKIDDVIDAIPVHGCCGILGVIVVGLFDKDKGLFQSGKGYLLGIQIIGVIIIIVWTAANCAIMFFVLLKFRLLRISEQDEKVGMDMAEHGGYAQADYQQFQKMKMFAESPDKVKRVIEK